MLVEVSELGSLTSCGFLLLHGFGSYLCRMRRTARQLLWQLFCWHAEVVGVLDGAVPREGSLLEQL